MWRSSRKELEMKAYRIPERRIEAARSADLTVAPASEESSLPAQAPRSSASAGRSVSNARRRPIRALALAGAVAALAPSAASACPFDHQRTDRAPSQGVHASPMAPTSAHQPRTGDNQPTGTLVLGGAALLAALGAAGYACRTTLRAHEKTPPSA
jgi:hypothetical protein